MLAFLIIIFPITVVEYIIGAVKTGKGGGISAWCVEFFVNVFIQAIHAGIYGIIGGVVMQHVRNSITADINDANWVILIISVNFLFEGEKIVKKIIKANNATSVRDSGQVFIAIKGAPGRVKGIFKG